MELDSNTLLNDENDKFHFKKVSLSFQLIVEDFVSSVKEEICPFFYSYETDLLSFRFQRNKPFETSFLKEKDIIPIEIYFPSSYTYLSEGIYTKVESKRAKVEANLHVNISRISNSNVAILNIVITNKQEDYFSESEIIKLLNFVGSKQENINLLPEIKFAEKNNNAKNDFCSFLQKTLKLKSAPDLRNGILQFDTSEIEFQFSDADFKWNRFYTKLRLGLTSLTEEQTELENLYTTNETFENLCNLLCGFALGIFDYNRMGFDEVTDTLKPLKSNDKYVLFKVRGILMNICHEDEMYEESLDSIGLSPYFIVPNMVLTYNEYQIETAFRVLEKTITEESLGDNKSVAKLRLVRNNVDEMIGSKKIPMVFQYKTERDILNYSYNEHGLVDLEEIVKNQLIQIDHIIRQKENEREAKSELFITILLTLLSCFQFQGIFESLLNNDHLLSWIYTTTLSFTVAFLIYYINKLKNKE